MVRIMNSYYSNLIEGNNTSPRDIERALSGQMDDDSERRDLQVESAAHVRLQAEIDELAANGQLPDPCDQSTIKWLHAEFYRGVSNKMLMIGEGSKIRQMVPGDFRSGEEQNVAVGRHEPPSSNRVAAFMAYFHERFRIDRMGTSARILAIATAHHRFAYIHPFLDGNGRVARLLSHAMAHHAGIGAQGLWAVSRGLARGINSRSDYKRMMDHADMPRQGDIDGRGNLSLAALVQFTDWFLKTCLDQIEFMSGLFELRKLCDRLEKYVGQNDGLRPETARLMKPLLAHGEIERGQLPAMLGLPERTARRVIGDLLADGIIGSTTERGPVSLRFPTKTHDVLFPRLFTES